MSATTRATGHVTFVGAGPGAADLLTLRALHAIAAADVVIWASSLVTAEVIDHAREDAEILDSKAMTLEDVVAVYQRAVAQDLRIARIHSGDPGIYGAVQEQVERCDALGLPWEIVPGVTSVAAVAAEVGRELTIPEVAQSVVFTRMATRTPMPPGEDIRSFAAHGTTMALLLSASRPRRLQAELLAGGYAPDTPCVVGYRVTWPDQQIERCRLEQLGTTIRAMGVTMHTVVLVGPALAADGTRSHLYSPAFDHTHRNAATTADAVAPAHNPGSTP